MTIDTSNRSGEYFGAVVVRTVNLASAALLACGSMTALSGWLFHIALLTRMSFTFAPTHFNTALCFLFYSIGIVASEFRAQGLVRVLATIIFATTLLTLSQYLFGVDFRIDRVSGLYLEGPGILHPGRMASGTAVALASLGVSLWLLLEQERTAKAAATLATLGSVVVAVGSGAFIGYVAKLHSLNGWVGFTQIGFPTAALCLLAGSNILWNVWVKFEADNTWLPIPLGIGLLALLLTLSQSLRADQDAVFGARVHATAQDFSDRTRSRLNDMFAALDRMSNRWDVGGGTPAALWQSDAMAHVRGYPGLVAIAWIETGGHVARFASAQTTSSLLVKRMLTGAGRGEATENAPRYRHPQITRAITLGAGDKGVLYVSPLYRDQKADGFQVAAIRNANLFNDILKSAPQKGFNVAVFEDGVKVFSSGPLAKDTTGWTSNTPLRTRNARWTISVTPMPIMITRERSALPEVFLGVGWVVIFLITLSLFLALRWRRIVRVLERREVDLERSEERYELAVKGAGVGLWDRNLTTDKIYWSPRFFEFLGITDPLFLPATDEFEKRVHPEDRRRVFANIAATLAAGSLYDDESRVRKADGSYVWLRLRGIPIFDAAGKLIRLAGSVDDISTLKAAEAALRASEELFRSTMDAAAVGIALLSPHGHLTRANPALTKLLGYSQEELIVINPHLLFPDAFLADRAQIAKLLSGEIGHYEMEQLFFRRDGKPLWLLVNGSLARDATGAPQHIVKQLLDISERKEVDRMKSEFISIVSHELRTPLTAIRGSLGLMATAMKNSLPEKALQLVQIGYRNSERLVALVNDILDMEKLAANRMQFELRQESLGELVQQSLEATGAYAQKYNVTHTVDLGVVDSSAFVDANRVSQIFANLLSNAVKFSAEGGQVEIAVSTANGRVRVAIRDHGPGIPEEFKPQIFGRFIQADSSIARKKGGTGLGLHITKELVERMGGTIGFESEAGKGTQFWVEFPHVSDEDCQTFKVEHAEMPRPRILVCDDDPETVELICSALQRKGCDTDRASSIQSARVFLAARVYQAMTLDLVLPDGDGIDLFNELRQNPKTLNLPVIVISIRSDDQDRHFGAAVPVIDWIAKPINEARLSWAIQKALSNTQGRAPCVLHVEDDEDLSSMLSAALKGRAEIITARTLKAAKECLATKSFAAVVLDIGMPDGSGLSMIDQIGSLPNSPPILVLSAQDVDIDISRRVAATMVKSRIAEADIADTVLKYLLAGEPGKRSAA